jgi:hypothetical protein
MFETGGFTVNSGAVDEVSVRKELQDLRQEVPLWSQLRQWFEGRDYVPRDFREWFDLVQSFAQSLETRSRNKERISRAGERESEKVAEEAEEDPWREGGDPWSVRPAAEPTSRLGDD